MKRTLSALVLCIVAAISGSAQATTVSVNVTNRLSIPREGTPITVGVPFAPGALASVNDLQVVGPNGTISALQANPIVTWYDGTPRWVLFDFPVQIGAGGTAVYTISDAGSAGGTSPLSVQESASEFVVRTGVLEFAVSKTDFRMLDRAALDTDANGSYELSLLVDGGSEGLVVRNAGGTAFTAHGAAPTTAVIEEQGPQRVTLLLRGNLTSAQGASIGLRYATRITAWAGRPDVRIQQTIHNPNSGGTGYGASGSIPFEDAAIELATTLPSATARVAGDAGSPTVDANLGAGDHLYLHQDSSGIAASWDKYATKKKISFRGWQAYVGPTGSEVSVASGDQARGWASVSDGVGSVAIAIDDFWQEFPNAIEAFGNGRLRASFFSPYQSGDHSLRAGEQKTHKMWVRFTADGGASVAQEMASLTEPLMGLASPEYYLSTKCFRRTVPVTQSSSSDYEDMQRATLYGGIGWRANQQDASLYRNREFDDVYGWWDYGDAYADYEHEGDRANLENDMVYGMILQMVRSGNRDWWDFIPDGAEHLADIDVYHTQNDLGWRNGGFFTHDRSGSNAHRTDYPQTGHYNAQGLFHYYYLSGDPVVRDSAVEIATNSAWRVLNESNGGHAGLWNSHELRIGGWLIPIIFEGYKLTKQQTFLDGTLAALQQASSATKCWDEGPGECGPGEYAPGNERDVKMWQLGMLMQAIGEVMEERALMTGQADAVGVQTLQDFGTFVQNWCWRADANRFAEGYNHDDGTTWIGAPGNNLRLIEGMVYAYRVTGDASLLTHMDEAFATANANPWYETSGVTFSNIKTQAVSNRNGGAWLEIVAEGIEPPAPCLHVLGTNPGHNQEWSPDQSLLILFDGDVDQASFGTRISASGSVSGAFTVSVNYTPFTAALTLSPAPQEGETVTITVADGVLDQDGNGLDGDNDGSCGGGYSFNAIVGETGSSGSDTVPPLNAGDAAISFAPGSGQALLSFTVPTDQGPTGGPTSLEVRAAVHQLQQAFVWDQATVVSGTPAPLTPGATQQFPIGTFDARNGILRVAVRFRDAAGNLSAISNIAQDASGPTVYFPMGPRIEMEAGDLAFVNALVSELSSGASAVRQLRWRYSGEALDQARYADLTPVGGDPALGIAEILVDGSTWVSGETHTLLVEGQDFAYSWSSTPGALEIAVVDQVDVGACLAVSDVWPNPDEPVELLDQISLVFDAAVDMSSVGSSSVTVTATGQSTPISTQFEWIVDNRVVRIWLSPPVDWATQVRVEVSSSVQSLEGKNAMAAGCTSEASYVFNVAPTHDPGPPVGGDLKALAKHGVVQVDGYNLVLTDLVPGDTLRIFSSAGHLVHQADIVDSRYAVDTSTFGKFEALLLTLVYRGHQQNIIVGERADYSSYLD